MMDMLQQLLNELQQQICTLTEEVKLLKQKQKKPAVAPTPTMASHAPNEIPNTQETVPEVFEMKAAISTPAVTQEAPFTFKASPLTDPSLSDEQVENPYIVVEAPRCLVKTAKTTK